MLNVDLSVPRTLEPDVPAGRAHPPRSSHDNRSRPAAAPVLSRRLAHGLALIAAALTWPLLLVGGSVTVYRVGMAVPDWPTTFGVNMFLYDFLNSSWGVFIEHSHRLYGAGVGLVCLILALGSVLDLGRPAAWAVPLATAVATVVALLVDGGSHPFLIGMSALALSALAASAWIAFGERQGGPALAWLVLAGVIGQGLLGGYRVRWNSTLLASLHGCTAQLFFALVIALCVVTGRAWSSPFAPPDQSDPTHLRRRAAVTMALVLTQIALGVGLRHFGDNRLVAIHVVFALAVWGHVLALHRRIRNQGPALAYLLPSCRLMTCTSTAQLLLGGLAWWLLRPFDGIPRSVWPAQAIIRIAHQGLAAFLLAGSVVLVLRSFRSLHSPARGLVSALATAQPAWEGTP